ncbi:hypothetical protein GE253_23055 [Niveispirillum sp. SYP-B3756]|uniref:hypothetical protein n=1 Tax=Niveispirillum sp. SYP-B3756 TaxID=2662178 RepID=UPI00129136AA|nr:hypothetical protein [Niveispirillum sp. SYP-B3756]MQP68201.1 hypothetical protein [Niveispirillum sp. SYP-B3756]
MKGILNVVTNVFADALAKSIRQHLSSFCHLSTAMTPAEPTILVDFDGSLVSFVEVSGASAIVGADEIEDICTHLESSFATFLSEPGHAIQLLYVHIPEAGTGPVSTWTDDLAASAQALGLDVEDFLTERRRVISRWVVSGFIYVALRTRPQLLTPDARRRALKLRSERLEKGPVVRDGQRPHTALGELRTTHVAFSTGVVRELGARGIRANLLSARQAAAVVRWTIDPEGGKDFGVVLPGDNAAQWPKKADFATAASKSPEKADISSVLPRDLATQLCDGVGEIEMLGRASVKMGTTYWSPVDVTLLPRKPRPFTDLLSRLQRTNPAMPWRISFLIEGGAEPMMKGFFATLLSVFNPVNAEIKSALTYLKELREAGEPVVRVRISAATWADTPNRVERYAADLANALEAWGEVQVSQLAGDPLEALTSSCLGFAAASTAPAAPIPLIDLLGILPWHLSAPAVKRGPLLLRTPDGQPYPHALVGEHMDAWFNIIIGLSGRGKSMLANVFLLAHVLAAESRVLKRLPPVGIIEIGRTSEGAVQILRDALPYDRRDEAVYVRLTNIASRAINVFDTPVGCRRPLPRDLQLVVNFICVLLTEPGTDRPYAGIVDLVRTVVQRAYADLDDTEQQSRPKVYQRGIDDIVDQALQRGGVGIDDGTTWWEVVDLLFDAGDIGSAATAQRHAVPTFYDLISAARSAPVEDRFADGEDAVRVDTQERLVGAFSRRMQSVIETYPVLVGPTRFSLGQARFISVDIEDVIGDDSAQGIQQTQIFYMLARYLACREFYRHEEYAPLVPERYRSYLTEAFREARQAQKMVYYAEFHRTGSSSFVSGQVTTDVLEGRKHNVAVTLDSQQISHFPKSLRKNASGIWVLGVGSRKESIDELVETFGLSNTARAIAASQLNGPGPGGAPLLMLLETREGPMAQWLYSTLGPVELWALSTSADDVELRRTVFKMVGPREGRRLLAKRFPKGSARGEIRDRINALRDDGHQEADARHRVFQNLAAEVISK